MGISCDSCRERVKDFFNKELTPEAYELCLVHMVGCDACHRFYVKYAKEKGIDCYISMEERMACGIGACLACVCKSAKKDAHTNVDNKRICKEGPVFDAKEVVL